MNRIMIVDDESLIREWLAMCLTSAGVPEDKIDQAKNGEEALSLFKNNIYDIIFADITMPKLDGIEIIKRIRKVDEAVRIVILTCHSDFEFARQAVKYDVCEYLLKNEISKEDIVTLKNKYLNDSDDEFDERNKRVEFLYKALQENSMVTKDDLEEHNITIPNSYFAISIQNRKFDISHFKTLYMRDCDIVECFFDGVSKVIILISMKDGEYLYGDILKYLDKRIIHLLGEQSLIGASGLYDKPELLGECLREAVFNWEMQFFGLKIQPPREHLNSDNNHIYDLKTQIKSMGENAVTQFGIAGKECVLDNLSQIYLFFVNKGLWNSELLKRTVIDVLEGIEAKVYIKDGGTETYAPKILNTNNWEEIEGYIKEFLCGISSDKVYSDYIKKAKKYIAFYYNKPITLSELANHVYLSEEYFSRLFKKEVGKNVTDYITELRMEKAITLLKKGTFSVSEVGEMVGITNQSYFSSKFKKIYGISPSSIKAD